VKGNNSRSFKFKMITNSTESWPPLIGMFVPTYDDNYYNAFVRVTNS